MSCLQCEERMSDYLEGALSPADRDTVDLHLQSCGACRDLKVQVHRIAVCGAERAFKVIRHSFFTLQADHSRSFIFPSILANSARPRLILDFTVPRGSFNISAISS